MTCLKFPNINCLVCACACVSACVRLRLCVCASAFVRVLQIHLLFSTYILLQIYLHLQHASYPKDGL